MNTTATIKADHSEHHSEHMRGLALANEILAGKFPPADYPLYTESDWWHAADMAIVDEDFSELLSMAAEELEHDREEEASRRDEYSGNPRQSWLGGVSMGRSIYRRGHTS